MTEDTEECEWCGSKHNLGWSSKYEDHEWDYFDECERVVPILLCADCEYK